MQLIWMSGPTSRVVTISITARKVVVACLLVAVTLFALGSLFNWLGLRVAIEYAPELAHQVGGVTSQEEFNRFQQAQHARLRLLEQRLSTLAGQMQTLEQAKEGFLERLGLSRRLSGHEGSGGQGGPLLWVVPAPGRTHEEASARLDAAMGEVQRLEEALTQVQQRWQQDLLRLDQVPSTLPLEGGFTVTSGLGFRMDPLTGWPSRHEGLDFSAPTGTPVHVTAHGRVLSSGFSGEYGELVEVGHADGFVTRYAHLQRRHVQEGDLLERGALVGWLGNTGRSSGPHLHYEVRYMGKPMHPSQALLVWSRRAATP